MRTSLFPVLAALSLLALGCDQSPSGPGDPAPETHESSGRRLGHIQSRYPVLAQDGETWEIEIQLDSLTILATLAEIQSYASDSLGKGLLRTRATEWYARDGECMFAAGKPDCLKISKGL